MVVRFSPRRVGARVASCVLVAWACAACGGRVARADDADAGSSSGPRWVNIVNALCADLQRTECARRDNEACVSVFVSERETAERHGCAESYDELLECWYGNGRTCQRGISTWNPGCEDLINQVKACTGGI